MVQFSLLVNTFNRFDIQGSLFKQLSCHWWISCDWTNWKRADLSIPIAAPVRTTVTIPAPRSFAFIANSWATQLHKRTLLPLQDLQKYSYVGNKIWTGASAPKHKSVKTRAPHAKTKELRLGDIRGKIIGTTTRCIIYNIEYAAWSIRRRFYATWSTSRFNVIRRKTTRTGRGNVSIHCVKRINSSFAWHWKHCIFLWCYDLSPFSQSWGSPLLLEISEFLSNSELLSQIFFI